INPTCSHLYLLYHYQLHIFLTFFFFNATATTQIYTLSLHDALPISQSIQINRPPFRRGASKTAVTERSERARIPMSKNRYASPLDRKSTRLNSSHVKISYAVFCLKKKKNNEE